MSEMTKSVLPDALRPFVCADLVRMGRQSDGGYLVDARNLQTATRLLSFGLSNDWSFERDVLEQKPIPIHVFDASVGLSHFRLQAFKGLFRCLSKPSITVGRVKDYLSYRRFFVGHVQHVLAFIGHGDLSYISVNQALQRTGASQSDTLFFKVDIEGDEYDILDELRALSHRTTGLAIELHDCHKNLPKILEFVQSYELKLVHVHANNFSSVTSAGLPETLELSFSNQDFVEKIQSLPHPLDVPNSVRSPEIKLSFE